jgi:protein-S-isoprenylcysteine O-methyltransferase Ste14
MKYLVIALLWTGYCSLHSYLISIRFTKWMEQLLKQYFAFYRLFYFLISIALLIPLLNYSSTLNDPVIFSYPPVLSAVRHVLMAASLLLFFWAFFFDYDSLSFFGIRQILNFGKTKSEEEPVALKRRGLLGFMRHPMYLALIVYLWCQTFSLTEVVVNLVLTIYVIIGTRLEERKLVLEFGDAYIKYKQEVPMLIPFTIRKAK